LLADPNGAQNVFLSRRNGSAMNFANDSMHTSLCLQFDPQQIATATVYLAAQFVKVQPVGDVDWLESLGQPDVETLASISLQICQLIAERKGAEESMFTKINRDLAALKNEKNAKRLRPEGTASAPVVDLTDAKKPRLA
jgi:carboxylesterase type B